MYKNAPVHQKSVVKRRSVEELKQKYKSPLAVNKSSKEAKSATPKMLRKSKVKRIAPIKLEKYNAYDNTIKNQEKTKPLLRMESMDSQIKSNSMFENEQIKSFFSFWFKSKHDVTNNTIHCGNQSEIAKSSRNRCRSMSDTDSSRSSSAKQVIEEDQPFVPPKLSESVRNFFLNAPIIEHTEENTKPSEEKMSQFWIKSGDFSIVWEIKYNETERLRSLYESFSQTSCEAKDLHFGIDDQKFCVYTPAEDWYVPKHVPGSKASSHYWFSTGDLTIPFSGKYLAPAKIQRIFRLIKETVEETGILRFGVDNVEFSNVPEFWHQTPKLRCCQNEMLVGLQSGDSNALEGCSKYAWPQIKPVTDNGKDNFKEIKCDRFSYSPFDSNHYVMAALDNIELSMPRRSLDIMSSDLYCTEYENGSQDQLCTDGYRSHHSYEINYLSTGTVPDMLRAVLNEKRRLNTPSISRPPHIPEDALDNLQGTPEYIEKLQSIVAEINRIGRSTQFKDCTVNELESYSFFLSCYAEVCSNSCSRNKA